MPQTPRQIWGGGGKKFAQKATGVGTRKDLTWARRAMATRIRRRMFQEERREPWETGAHNEGGDHLQQEGSNNRRKRGPPINHGGRENWIFARHV